jgi:pimeloyl-ACP methyl ester carboxylesterase
LRDQFRCIAVDYLGFGLSERPSGFNYRIEQHAQVVGELVDHLNLDGYLTMGQDWCGPISMAVDGDHMLVELPDAKHYIQEDAPERITEAIRDRFG